MPKKSKVMKRAHKLDKKLSGRRGGRKQSEMHNAGLHSSKTNPLVDW